jgi:hypothetical protein
MVQPVDALAQAFCRAGADLVSFHPDASTHVDRTLQLIRAEGWQAGLVFNPGEPLDVLEWTIDQIDLVLIMSVNPGFGGQSFIEGALRKIERVRRLIDASGRDIRLEVDGGIKVDNIRRVAERGKPTTFVAGSADLRQDTLGDYDLGLPGVTRDRRACAPMPGWRRLARVFGGDSFERRKPDPLPLLRTCEALGSAPGRTLMVGDSANDALAARAAGCPVVLVRYGYNHGEPIERVDADGWIDRIDELPGCWAQAAR